MGCIALLREETTVVSRIDNHIVITQYDDDERETEIGRIVLTIDQFREIYNHEKHILAKDEDGE